MKLSGSAELARLVGNGFALLDSYCPGIERSEYADPEWLEKIIAEVTEYEKEK
jgi:hypothetical protein